MSSLWLLLFRMAASASTERQRVYATADLIYTCTASAIIPTE